MRRLSGAGLRRDLLRYYFDEHLRHVVAAGLRSHGVDVLTAAEAGRAGRGIPDEDQLAFATREGRVLVSHDADFTRLAHSHLPHAGVIYLQSPLSIGDSIDFLEYMAHTATVEDVRNQLIFCAW